MLVDCSPREVSESHLKASGMASQATQGSQRVRCSIEAGSGFGTELTRGSATTLRRRRVGRSEVPHYELANVGQHGDPRLTVGLPAFAFGQ